VSASNSRKQQLIAEFRANAGELGGALAGATLLLLTTTGAKSGARTVTPLGVFSDGDQLLVCAAGGGQPRHPAWYHNLLADPLVTVDLRAETFPALATVLTRAERERVWPALVARAPILDDPQRGIERIIPVVALRRYDSH
jgi:deazaflavin-dependent oxidoreductase (nitroreductase family)